LPSYLAEGGPLGKGHVSFDRAQSQSLDGGAQSFNLATNGGFTAGVVVRFTGRAGEWEGIFDFGHGPDDENIVLFRELTSDLLTFMVFEGSDIVCSVTATVIVKNTWMTIVARYHHQSQTVEIRSNNEVVVSTTCSTAPTDRTLSKTYVGRSNWDNEENFNGDIAGLFVVDEYLSTEVTSFILKEVLEHRSDFLHFEGIILKKNCYRVHKLPCRILL